MFHHPFPPAVTGEIVSMASYFMILFDSLHLLQLCIFYKVKLVNKNALLSHALYICFQIKRHESVRAFNYICK